jgi:uncharacterized cupredoxin-like copper-binding protein
MIAAVRRDARLLIAACVAVVVLAAGSTVALAAATGQFDTRRPARTVRSSACGAAPALPGAVIEVSLSDMASMMRPSGQRGWRTWHAGMMRVAATPASAPAGTVSLRVTNVGVMRHELLVLPLPATAVPGQRAVGDDGTADEAVSLGEASRDCAAGSGDGITPGATGWITLTLPPGRYELLCNLPGHYAAGMFAELDVT